MPLIEIVDDNGGDIGDEKKALNFTKLLTEDADEKKSGKNLYLQITGPTLIKCIVK